MNILTHNKSGIYEIRNTTNGHLYIGSAVNLKQRWHDHKKLLRGNKHHSKHLQNAWNKYGESAFSFAVLRYVERKEDLIINEQEYIDSCNPEYNVCRVAGSTLGFKQPPHVGIAVGKASHERIITDEYRRNMSNALKGRIITDEHRKKIGLGRLLFFLKGGRMENEKAINQFSMNGEFIARYESVADAARKTGAKDTHISRCARGGRKSTRGYVWRYAEE